VIVGSDFHFGHQRRGNVALLAQMGAELGFAVEGMALVDVDGAPAAASDARVSSTAIRRALAAGDLAAANDMLGRPHEVRGTVEAGGSGAVEVPPSTQLPADGTYAVTVDGEAGTATVADGVLRLDAATAGRRVVVQFVGPC
jgi:riboflavin kinase/FMN adenylyltransferase